MTRRQFEDKRREPMTFGVVKWFNAEKGFGFVTQSDGADVFVHYASIVGEGYRALTEKQRVRMRIQEGTRGPSALDVTPISQIPAEQLLFAFGEDGGSFLYPDLCGTASLSRRRWCGWVRNPRHDS
jgi:CspA family cold shock protein